MRCMTAAGAKSKHLRYHRGTPLQEKPREGSRIRAIYDLLQTNKGKPVEIEVTGTAAVSVIIIQLENFYGLDIRRIQNGYRRTGRKSIYVLAGEWFGRVYVDYIAEHLSSLSPHSSDVEQPHCRRTRADSSPAAGTTHFLRLARLTAITTKTNTHSAIPTRASGSNHQSEGMVNS